MKHTKFLKLILRFQAISVILFFKCSSSEYTCQDICNLIFLSEDVHSASARFCMKHRNDSPRPLVYETCIGIFLTTHSSACLHACDPKNNLVEDGCFKAVQASPINPKTGLRACRTGRESAINWMASTFQSFATDAGIKAPGTTTSAQSNLGETETERLLKTEADKQEVERQQREAEREKAEAETARLLKEQAEKQEAEQQQRELERKQAEAETARLLKEQAEKQEAEQQQSELERKQAEEEQRMAEEARIKAEEELRMAEEAQRKAEEEQRKKEEAERKILEQRALAEEAEKKAAEEKKLKEEADKQAEVERLLKAEAEFKALEDQLLKDEAERKAQNEQQLREEAERKESETQYKLKKGPQTLFIEVDGIDVPFLLYPGQSTGNAVESFCLKFNKPDSFNDCKEKVMAVLAESSN